MISSKEDFVFFVAKTTPRKENHEKNNHLIGRCRYVRGCRRGLLRGRRVRVRAPQHVDGWVGERNGCQAPPEKGWKIENGVLTVLPRKGIKDGKWVDIPKEQAALGGGGDLVTAKDFRDFELSVDFLLTEAANSGIKYFYNKDQFKGTCEEYQILHEAHPDSTKGRDGKCRRVASLYDMIPANAEPYVKPLGQWNTAKIVSKGNHVEHWLNGHKVLVYERGSAEFRAIVAQSKYVKEQKPGEHWGEAPTGRIKLQDHSNSTVSFRNIKIREL